MSEFSGRRAVEAAFWGISADSDDLVDDSDISEKVLSPSESGGRSSDGKPAGGGAPPMMMGGAGMPAGHAATATGTAAAAGGGVGGSGVAVPRVGLVAPLGAPSSPPAPGGPGGLPGGTGGGLSGGGLPGGSGGLPGGGLGAAGAGSGSGWVYGDPLLPGDPRHDGSYGPIFPGDPRYDRLVGFPGVQGIPEPPDRPGWPTPDGSYPGYPWPGGPGGSYPGHPQPGYPQPGVPAPGYPYPGVPGPGYPQPGHPQPGYPGPGFPQPGVPQPGVPGFQSGGPNDPGSDGGGPGGRAFVTAPDSPAPKVGGGRTGPDTKGFTKAWDGVPRTPVARAGKPSGGGGGGGNTSFTVEPSQLHAVGGEWDQQLARALELRRAMPVPEDMGFLENLVTEARDVSGGVADNSATAKGQFAELQDQLHAAARRYEQNELTASQRAGEIATSDHSEGVEHE